MAVRTRRCTGCPTRLKSSRTSWVFPSPTTTFHHEFIPAAVSFSNATSFGTTHTPSTTVPLRRATTSASSGTPFTLARYSRSTP